MTNEQLIEEILMESESLGIRNAVIAASKKYIDQGMTRLESMETAFSELSEVDADITEYDECDECDEDDAFDDLYSIYDGDDDEMEDWSTTDDAYWGNDDEDE